MNEKKDKDFVYCVCVERYTSTYSDGKWSEMVHEDETEIKLFHCSTDADAFVRTRMEETRQSVHVNGFLILDDAYDVMRYAHTNWDCPCITEVKYELLTMEIN